MARRQPAKLLFASARAYHFDTARSLQGKLRAILQRLKFGSRFEENEMVAIKMHLGNPGVHRTIPPLFVREVVDELKRIGARPFVTDSARLPGYIYLQHAWKNGYNPLSLGCPVVIADGLFGNDSIKVKAGKYLEHVSIPSAIYDATGMVVLTHVTGHVAYGFGGALKNVAMGCVSQKCRGEKWYEGDRGRMHTLGGRDIQKFPEKCTHCGACVEICPTESISFAKKGVVITDETCFRCARCAHVCQFEALVVDEFGDDFYEALAEAAKAVDRTFKKGKIVHMSFLIGMQPECDCMPMADTPILQDIGILAGEDCVAIDRATLDLAGSHPPLPDSRAEGMVVTPENDAFSLVADRTPRVTLKHAVKLGLGTNEYKLSEVRGMGKAKK
jgi:uncharacterized Fe-S center protein